MVRSGWVILAKIGGGLNCPNPPALNSSSERFEFVLFLWFVWFISPTVPFYQSARHLRWESYTTMTLPMDPQREVGKKDPQLEDEDWL